LNKNLNEKRKEALHIVRRAFQVEETRARDLRQEQQLIKL
jgi:hypothetical protein